jgi:hypothetical protein
VISPVVLDLGEVIEDGREVTVVPDRGVVVARLDKVFDRLVEVAEPPGLRHRWTLAVPSLSLKRNAESFSFHRVFHPVPSTRRDISALT